MQRFEHRAERFALIGQEILEARRVVLVQAGRDHARPFESYRRRAALDRKRGPGRPPTRATIKENAD